MKRIACIAIAAALSCCLLPACSSGGQSASSPAASGAASGSAASAPASTAAATQELADGTYSIQVNTDSNMFHITACSLKVAGGQMTATITLPGEGFSLLCFGTTDEAAKAADDDIYNYELDKDGKYTFELPVSALDQEMQIAAWGQRRERWYQHSITFCSPVAPGEYTVAVSLDGGTGRATVESPARIVAAEDGSCTATIVWSSPNYDQMVVDDQKYLPVNDSGNSTFEIPVRAFDRDLEVQAETTAMSEPHMIDYKLRFDSSTLAGQ